MKFGYSCCSQWRNSQTALIANAIKELLDKYKFHCRLERKCRLEEDGIIPPLLPVSFALAKDWILLQQKYNQDDEVGYDSSPGGANHFAWSAGSQEQYFKLKSKFVQLWDK